MDFVDTHCHLQFKDYPDRVQVIEAAKAAGVTKLICVGTQLHDCEQAIGLADKFDKVWAACGSHPHEAEDFVHVQNSAQQLEQLLTKPKVVAVGEIGLDYYKDYASKDDQKAALKIQIELGLKTGLPFIFHVRDAWEDFWPIFDSYPNIRGVIHSFSAHPQQLQEVLSRRLYVGLNGIMTFTKDDQQLAAAKQVPLDKLLLETDAPFLTPAPFRGTICEPKHLKTTAEFLAELRGETLEQLATATTQNAHQLFNI